MTYLNRDCYKRGTDINQYLYNILGDMATQFSSCRTHPQDKKKNIPEDVKEDWLTSRNPEYYTAKTSYRLASRSIENKEIPEYMVGVTFENVERSDDAVTFTTDDGCVINFYHVQDCCESVYIEDVIGNIKDLVGSPLVFAYENSNHPTPPSLGGEVEEWTFYNFSSNKGSVTIRWYGTSNGYYSTSVDVSVTAWQKYTTVELASPKILLH